MRIGTDRRSAWIAAAGLLTALALRVAEVVWNTGTIDTEGAEYARLAENLRAGHGYVGMATDGQQLFFPPIYPLLIWAGSFVAPDAETAARAISVLAGSLMALSVSLLARRLYGGSAGLVALWLVALHPLFVRFSATAYCEMTYLALLVTAIWLATVSAASTRRRDALLSGACFGAAALARQEALVAMAVATLLLLLASPDPWRLRLRRAWLLPLSGVLIFLPYATWLSLQSGHVRIEGKSPLNAAMLERMQAGASSYEAGFSVDANLIETGAYIQPNRDAFVTHPLSREEALDVVLTRIKSAIRSALAHLTADSALGAPPLFALALVGLLMRPLGWRDVYAPVLIAAVLSLTSAAPVFIYYDSVRFYLAFVPLLCIFAGAGVVATARWGRDTAVALGGRPDLASAAGGALGLVAAASVLICAYSVVPGDLSNYDASKRPIRAAGEWLRETAGPSARVMDTNVVVAYHARADVSWFPYCDETTAIRYIDKKNVQYLVLRDWRSDAVPYLRRWLDQGVPDGRGTVVYSTTLTSGERIRIVRWNRSPSNERGHSESAQPLEEPIAKSAPSRSAPSTAR